MYRPPQYVVDDVSLLHKTIRSYPFATIARSANDQVEFAYTPVVLDEKDGPVGQVRFHFARANPLVQAADEPFFFSFRGPDAYVSPDWYRSEALVPTWNYVAIEGHGTAHRLDDDGLRALLIDLSAQEEARLAPKTPWTMDKVPAERQAGLMRAIVGFSLRFDALKGKFKLSQDKPAQDVEGVLRGLEERGDGRSRAVSAAMKSIRRMI
jgi:transcriptional regulator